MWSRTRSDPQVRLLATSGLAVALAGILVGLALARYLSWPSWVWGLRFALASGFLATWCLLGFALSLWPQWGRRLLGVLSSAFVLVLVWGLRTANFRSVGVPVARYAVEGALAASALTAVLLGSLLGRSSDRRVGRFAGVAALAIGLFGIAVLVPGPTALPLLLGVALASWLLAGRVSGISATSSD